VYPLDRTTKALQQLDLAFRLADVDSIYIEKFPSRASPILQF
jgi:hypothetical protein